MNEIDINELSDYSGYLQDLQKIIAKLIEKHGAKATIRFDAGHNNISCYVKEPLKK